MGCMYAWASPEYLLDHMTMEQVVMYYEKGLEAQQLHAQILCGVLGQAISGKQNDKKTSPNLKGDKPDLAAFRSRYGNMIKKG